MTIRGHYIIAENLIFNMGGLREAALLVRAFSAAEQVHHVSVRNCEAHNSSASMMYAVSYIEGITVENVVFYNNHIHPDNMVPPDASEEPDNSGIALALRSNRIWIVDNHIHHLGGDCLGSGHAANYTATNYYIGRNILHDTSENAVDFKEMENVIVSENAMYNFAGGSSGDGGDGCAAVVHYGPRYSPRNVWFLYNEIYNTNGTGIQVGGDQVYTVHIIGNIIRDIRNGLVVPYMFESFDEHESIFPRLLQKGYVDAQGRVNPGFTVLDGEFRAWFRSGYDQFVYIENLLRNTLDSEESATGYRSWNCEDVYMINNVFHNIDNGIDSEGRLFLYNNIISNISSDGYHISVARTADRTVAEISHDIFHQPGGEARIDWGSSVYNIQEFQSNTGKGQGCLEVDPLFVDPSNNSFYLQASSPAIDAGMLHPIYQLFQDTFGIDIRTDRSGRPRPPGAAWDIGAWEYGLAGVGDILVSGTSENSLTVSWTMPGDEGTGRPTLYDIRYATSTITEATWDTATQVQGEPVPGDCGESQSFTITGLNPGTTYYVAIKTGDEAGHSSLLSNVVSGTTTTSGNHAPVMVPIGERSVVEGATLTLTISANDADGDALSYSAMALPTDAHFDPATRTFTWTPTFEDIGLHHATFEVTDGQVTVSQTIAITVLSGTNHPPVLAAIGGKSTSENQALTFSVSATDIDGQAITYSATNLPSGASFVGQTFTWTPSYMQAGSYSVTFTASDGTAEDSETVTIAVANVNQPPVLAGIGDRSTNENIPMSFSLSAADPDGGTLSYSATGLPSGANLAGGVFAWTPAYSQAGSYPVTFSVSDGALTDSEQITITVMNISDETPPSIRDLTPAADGIQAPLNTLVALTVADGGLGVDPATVSVYVDDVLVYTGDVASYESDSGVCRRTGTAASYRYQFQPAQLYGCDQQVSVRVNASDMARNAMAAASYSFFTQMQSFGANESIIANAVGSGCPAVATDNQGNIWAVWHAGEAGARDVYLRQRDGVSCQWGEPVQLTSPAGDECYPAIAIGADDTLYVVWQDNRRGNWDIFASVSADGATWSEAVGITNAQDDQANQTNPAIVANSATPAGVYVAWEDDGAGNQEIYLASSTTSFASKTTTRITSNAADQTGPALAVGSDNAVYLVWTDRRNGSADIYGASSASAWANTAIATGPSEQQSPAIAIEPGTSWLYLLWVEGTTTSADILCGISEGLPASAIVGSSIIDDDDVDAARAAPAVVATQDHWGNTHVYACWQDGRSVPYAGDSDLYFVELQPGAGPTNVLVGDDGANSNQSEPALGFDEHGQPVVLWADNRGETAQVYSAFSTYFKPTPLASGLIADSTGGRVGTDPAAIEDEEDVSIEIPDNACGCDLVFSISKVQNPPTSALPCLAGYEIGPSGVQFSSPATVTIPYRSSDSSPTPCWYNVLTANLSRQGITDVTHTTLANGLSVVSFKTTHLTTFYLSEAAIGGGSSGGGGGGCALSSSPDASILGFFLPYSLLVPFMILLRRRDRRRTGDASGIERSFRAY